MDATHLDRQAVETLFGVGERRARQLMAGLAGIRAGNTAAISRRALIEQMREFATSQPCQREVRPADPPSVRRPARSHPVHARRAAHRVPGLPWPGGEAGGIVAGHGP